MRSPTPAPYFEDLARGQVLASAPTITLTDGLAAQHQAILGDRLLLALDTTLAREVIGAATSLAHPGLVCDIAIGQSTGLTQRVIGNLFYRGLVFHRLPLIGDTLRTTTEVVGLRQNSAKPGRSATGLAALRIRTVDHEGREILDFHRCAMLPLRDGEARTGEADDMTKIGSPPDRDTMIDALAGWDLGRFRDRVAGPHSEALEEGTTWNVAGADVVSSAPELARLSLNVAFAHHDRYEGRAGRRLLYGGHTIGIAAAQLNRALPNLLTILGWQSCDHLGPVFEGDTLRSTVELEGLDRLPAGGALIDLRSRVVARGEPGEDEREVLDWRLFGAMA
ncbi:MAG TPA: acyl dehydratase [Solirubrobacterales bacterium]|jgi:acyl dehydratase|nr:acyl dehydratase [Solirubrobacterales bacterium]